MGISPVDSLPSQSWETLTGTQCPTISDGDQAEMVDGLTHATKVQTDLALTE